ncbi:MAG TPA: hypothetical protein VFD48_10160 [Pyrinomonadaceae bacterium]|nr:hypothetical protein [Pyrinomonadaceae bacterium]
MDRALKGRSEHRPPNIMDVGPLDVSPNECHCVWFSAPIQGAEIIQLDPGAARKAACPWLPSATPPALLYAEG